jgi:hypothetical protein
VNVLEQRQVAAQSTDLTPFVATKLSDVAKTEKDVLWVLGLPSLKESWPINLLFPTFPVLNLINNIPPALTLFQFYRSIIMPLTQLMVPISTVVGPWWYIRRTLKIELSFKRYCKYLYSALKMGLAPSDNFQANASKYFSLFMYIFFYIYGIIQSFQHAAMLRKIQAELSKKMAGIRKFVVAAHDIIKTVPAHCITAFNSSCDVSSYLTKALYIPNGMSGLYKLMTNCYAQEQLRTLLRAMWAVDACTSVHKLVNSGTCCIVKYSEKSTKFWHMGHINLKSSQVRNPASLYKNLIITGPNAAGKTTYVRSILTNVILSQSLGIACAKHAEVFPIHAMGTFLRISDNLGTSSLFEAEVRRCAELIKQAETTAAQGKRAMYFLDEPMHSTPPIEGSATSKAVIEYIGNLPGVRVLVTTHYHDLVTMTPSRFHNISMDAIKQESSYIFPYKIQKGPSFKCIALELLDKNKLPSAIVSHAISIKNAMVENSK